MATQVSGASAWLTINNRALSFRSGEENTALGIVEYSNNTIRITNSAPDQLIITIDDQELETARHGIWDWRPMHFAGLYQLIVTGPGVEKQIALVRVFPQKFSQQRYERMKNELSEIAIDLLFRLDSPALEKTKYARRDQDTSALHDYKQIRSIMHEMQDVISHLQRDAYSVLQEHTIQQDWQHIGQFTATAVPQPGERVHLPEPFTRRRNIASLPQRWNVPINQPTYDVYENRLLKQFIQQQLIAKLNSIRERAESERQQCQARYQRYHNQEDGVFLQKLGQVINECQNMKQRCIRWGSEPFLKSVQTFAPGEKVTQVLLKHPTYNRFYRLYLRFQQRLMTTLDATTYTAELANRRVSELYEMWSVFLISKIIIEELMAVGYRMASNSTFYEVQKNYFQFDVQRNVDSIVMEKSTTRIVFTYEPEYPNRSVTRNQETIVATSIGAYPLTPDLAIGVYEEQTPQYLLIFDAKYRWDKQQNRYYPKQEDIDKMTRYYSNIQYQYYDAHSRPPYKIRPIVSSAYILYPGNSLHTENNDRIGSLPLAPGIAQQHLTDVREKLKDLLYYAYVIDK